MTVSALAFGASLFLSLIMGVLLTYVFLPGPKDGGNAMPSRIFAGGGLGIGVTSCLYFACMTAGITGYILWIELLFCLLLGGIGFVGLRRDAANDPPQTTRGETKRTPLELLLAGILSIELLASLASFFFAWREAPHGKWDAWLIWNMHARFLYRMGEAWREVFSGGMDWWTHWDYPLLLPLSIVRSWKYMGAESVLVPAAFAFFFWILTLGLLLFALAHLRGRTQGYLGAMVLLGTPLFILMGASQFADIPLAFFMLATLVLLHRPRSSSDNPPGALILAGLAAALSAWTKNEGLLFFPIVAATLLFTEGYAKGWKTAWRGTALFLAGALPVLLTVACFKTQLSPTNDLVAGFDAAAVTAKLTDIGRYAEVAKAFLITGISFTQGLFDARKGMSLNIGGAVTTAALIGYLFLMGVRIDRRERIALVRSAAVLGLMLLGFFFVYVLTPRDLGYHLATSLNRLFLQLWPSVIFLGFMIAGSPEPDPSAGGGPGAAAAWPETGSTGKRKSGKTRRRR